MQSIVRGSVAVLLVAATAGCADERVIDTTLTFDGERRTISTPDVTCTRYPGGGLVILVSDGRKRSVRAALQTRGRLVVERIGLRHNELAGFVADPFEVDAIKVDDTYTFRGRMPPDDGETQWHYFEITTTCPGYSDPAPPSVN